MAIATIDEAVADIRDGRMIIIIDDEDRENEGDLVCAAEKVTPEIINFMARHARGTFAGVEDHGESWTVRIGFPKDIGRYFVFKGSVAVEGISLTIAELKDDYFEIAIIPKTWEVTNLSHLKPGDGVNLEVDVIAKYVERLVQHE